MRLKFNILSKKCFKLTVGLVLMASLKIIAAEGQVSVDLRKGLIGPITVFDNPDVLKTKLNASNMQAYTGQSEGQEYHGYKLKFTNGQTVDANQSYLEINSVGFRTPEGLGVGSTWKEFKAAYSDGELSWLDDADAIWSEKYKFRLYFKDNKKPAAADHVTAIHMNRGGVEPW